MALRLALTLTYLHWALSDEEIEPHEISFSYMAVAIDLLDGYFAKMAERVFGDACLPEIERNAATLAREILKRGTSLKKINGSDIRTTWRLPSLRTAGAVDAACDELVDRGWLIPAGVRESKKEGRGSAGRLSKDYEIRKRLWRIIK